VVGGLVWGGGFLWFLGGGVLCFGGGGGGGGLTRGRKIVGVRSALPETKLNGKTELASRPESSNGKEKREKSSKRVGRESYCPMDRKGRKLLVISFTVYLIDTQEGAEEAEKR